MPALECENGHPVFDESALRCPDCGTYVRSRGNAPKPYPPDVDSTTPQKLLLGSLALSAGAGLAFLVTAGADYRLAVVLACLIGFAAATMWVVACVAIGVRVALRSEG